MCYSISTLKSCFYTVLAQGSLKDSILREIPRGKNEDFDECLTAYLTSQQQALKCNERNRDLQVLSPFCMEKMIRNGKAIYQMKSDLLSDLYMELLCNDLKECYPYKLYRIKDVMQMIEEGLESPEKYMLLCYDVVHFSESIPAEKIFERLRLDGKLSIQSIELLKSINQSYKDLSGSENGVPRGIRSMTILAEIYMQEIDRQICALPGVCRYGRLVDDTIMFADPTHTDKNVSQLFQQIQFIYDAHGLTLHEPNEFPYKGDLIENKANCQFHYFQYQIEKQEGQHAQWLIKESVSLCYMLGVRDAIDHFLQHLASPSSSDTRIHPLTELLCRLRELTSNSWLCHRGKRVRTGLAFSLPMLTSIIQIETMDVYLQQQLQRIRAEKIPDYFMGASVHFTKEETAAYILKRCSKYSFTTGYVKHKFSKEYQKHIGTAVKEKGKNLQTGC